MADIPLRSAEARHRAILDSALDAIVTIDAAGKIVEFNVAAERLFGYSAEEATGREMADLIVPPELRGAHRAGLARHVATAESVVLGRRLELEAMRRDGTRFPAEVSIVRIGGEGEDPLFTGFIRDLTESRLMEAAAELADARLRTTLESLSDAFLTMDASWRFTYLNGRAEAMLGRSRGELLGRVAWEAFPDAKGSNFELQYEKAIAEQRTVQFEEYYPPIDRWLELTAYPLQDGIAVQFRDVSARKAEQAAREALEAALRDSQKMEAIGRLAGGVAHDFNNIVAAILGNVELARSEGGNNPALRECLDEIRKAGDRGRELVAQILSFSRRMPAVRRRLDLAPVVRDATGLIRPTVPPRIRIVARVDPDAPLVLADPTQVTQVLINLCTNAAQAIGNANGHIEVRVGQAALGAGNLGIAPDLPHGRYARIGVSDNGPGMAPEVLRHIFEPFFTTKEIGQGTGLGLSVVHGIVRSHGGDITVASEPGRGTRFDVYLPAVEGPADQDEAAAAAPDKQVGAGQRVLYLDDDEAQVFMVKRLLERKGYAVSGFLDPEKALAALRVLPRAFDVVITDHNMPGRSGIEVAREVRAMDPALPVIVTSGYVSEDLVAQAKEAGVRDVIFKAHVVTDYVDAIERLALRR